MRTLFLNPFEKYSEKTLLLFGLLFSLLGGFLGFVFNARFDGAVDLHFMGKVNRYQPFLDVIIAIFSTTLLLFAIGKYNNKKTRLIDMLSLSMIARIPFYLLTFFNLDNKIYTISKRILDLAKQGKTNVFTIDDMGFFLLFSFVTILTLVWSITLFFNGFKVATNAKETNHTLFFILAMILSEVLSKILITTLI